MGCRITTEYTRRGIETAFLENDQLRIEVLTGKGGDITEIIDKRTDVNVLFEAPHKWYGPDIGPLGKPDGSFTFLDHYPGGWQDVLPTAGGPATVDGAPLSLHGETTLVPWKATISTETDDRVELHLSVELSRYPLEIDRRLILESGTSLLTVEETVENLSDIPVDYSWLQHIALGEPLVGPEAMLEVPCNAVLSDPELGPNAQFPADEVFHWPIAELSETKIDLRKFPPKDAQIHDLLALTDLEEGKYTVTNPSIDLGVTVRFPAEIYEYLWYWRAFGGFEDAPFFGRNYNAGLEPSTSIPNAGLDAARDAGTANTLAPHEKTQATISLETHRPR
jgi:galactose mutarotase-like enzyme